MKRNQVWVLALVVAAAAGGWALGQVQATSTGFEFTVEVTADGTRLVAGEGCQWRSASYRGAEALGYSFVVDEAGVRSVGVGR